MYGEHDGSRTCEGRTTKCIPEKIVADLYSTIRAKGQKHKGKGKEKKVSSKGGNHTKEKGKGKQLSVNIPQTYCGSASITRTLFFSLFRPAQS